MGSQVVDLIYKIQQTLEALKAGMAGLDRCFATYEAKMDRCFAAQEARMDCFRAEIKGLLKAPEDKSEVEDIGENCGGTQSDNGCETKVVVKTSVSLLTKQPMVTQAVQALGITMPLPTSKVIFQEDVKQDLGQKHVILDPVLANQKEQSMIKELGCKSVRITEAKMALNQDFKDNSGTGNGFGSYNSLDVWWLVSDDKQGMVHGCHNRNLNGKGHLIDHSDIFWPSAHVIIGFGSREVYYGDDYPWDPGINRSNF